MGWSKIRACYADRVPEREILHARQRRNDSMRRRHPRTVYRVDNDGRLSWTEAGIRTYRKRFARFGLRIEAIATLKDYRTALTLSAAGFQDQLMATATHGPPRWNATCWSRSPEG